MGNNLSENLLWYSTNPELDLSESNLRYLKTKKDSRIGDVDRFEHIPTKKKLLRKEILIEDPAQLTSDNLEKLKARVHLRHKNILESYGFSLEISRDGPSKLSLFFEPFLSDAAAAFDSMQKKQTFFGEEELFGSLKATVQALAHLRKHNISHGHITPNSILMSPEGDIKILDHSLIEQEHSAYAACLQGSRTSYLAPELFNLLGSETDIPSDFNAFKADIFSLGMTFLHGALLEEPSDCYSWETHYFDFIKLVDRLDRLRAKYPAKISNIISNMVKVDIAQRPDAQTLLASLEADPKTQSNTLKQHTFSISDRFKGSNTASPSTGSLKASQHLTPRIDTQGLPMKKYTFVDPKVQEIIRESRQRNWIKATLASRSKSPQTEEKQRIPSYSPTGLRYANAFLDDNPPLAYLNRSKHESPRLSAREAEEGEFDAKKFPFNRPQVNEIIANIIKSRTKSKSPERRLDSSGVYTHYLESPFKDSARGEEKSHRSKPSYGIADVFPNYKTPEKKGLAIEDLYKNYLDSEAKDLAGTNYSYQKRGRSKEDIIRELREKYGTRSKGVEDQQKVSEIA